MKSKWNWYGSGKWTCSAWLSYKGCTEEEKVKVKVSTTSTSLTVHFFFAFIEDNKILVSFIP